MTVDDALADVHRHLCSADGTAHDDACVALRNAIHDQRPVDLGAVIDLLEQEIDNVGEVGIYGGYGPPAAPVGYLNYLVRLNADHIEKRVGEYAE